MPSFADLRFYKLARGALSSWRFPRLKSLKARLILEGACVALVALAVIDGIASHAARQIASSEARKRVEAVAECFAAVVAEPLAAKDRLQMRLAAKAFRHNGVIAILVTDRQGRTILSSDASAEDGEANRVGGLAALPASSTLEDPSRNGVDCLHATKSVRFGGAEVGTIRLWLNKLDMEESIRKASVPVYGIFLLGSVLLVLLGLVNLCRPFSALKRMNSAASQIRAGDLSVRVPVDGTDDIAEFCTTFNLMVEGLAAARQEASAKQLETILAMINAVEAKDQYTAGHCLRVGGYCRSIVDRCSELPPQQVFLIQTASMLHDIGKLGIPDRVLLKQDKLTPEENTIIQNHVIIGEGVVSHLDSMKEISRWIRHHHERWDGGGYPDGLKGEEIPFASRVITVSDSIDAMLTDRPYRKALTIDKAIEVLREGREKQFDPKIVDLAVEILAPKRGNDDESRSLDSVTVPVDHELELQVT